MAGDAWSDDDVERLIFLRYNRRLSHDDCAYALHRTLPSVRQKLAELVARPENRPQQHKMEQPPPKRRNRAAAPETTPDWGAALSLAKRQLRREIEAARQERATAVPYKPPAGTLESIARRRHASVKR